MTDQFKKYYEDMRAWSDAVFARFITEAVFTACIDLPFENTVRLIVGYNPQKLLPDTRMTSKTWIGEDGTRYSVLSFRTESSGVIADFFEEDGRRWWPIDGTFGEIFMPKGFDLEREFIDFDALPTSRGIDFGKIYDRPGWNSPGATPVEDIAEMLRMMRKVRRSDVIPIFRTEFDFKDKRVARKRDQGYLKHDPTKSHRRRRK